MSIPTGSITRLPEDIWGKIATHCDVRTLYAFRGSCRAANAAGKEYMSEEVAARVIFHHPERYHTLRLNALKESRKVVVNALTNLPELILEPSFPEKFRADKEMLKTAFVAARMLHKEGAISIIRVIASTYKSELQDLDQQIEDMRFPGLFSIDVRDLLQSVPFFAHASSFELESLRLWKNRLLSTIHPISNDIIDNIDIASRVLKKTGLNYTDVFYKFLGNEEVAQAVLPSNPGIFQYLRPYVRNNKRIARLAIAHHWDNIYHISPRLQLDIPFMIDVACDVLQTSRCHSNYFDAFYDNEDFGRAVVQRHPFFFAHLSERLRKKDDIMDIALQGDERNIRYVSDHLKDDASFVDRHIKNSKDGLVFQVASDRIRSSVRSSYLAVSKNLTNITSVSFKSTSTLQKIALCASIVFGVATRPFVSVYDQIVRHTS